MPGSRFAGPRFLDQHMIMEDLYPPGFHQSSRSGGGRGMPDHLLEFRNTGPVTVIIKKAAGFPLFFVVLLFTACRI